MLSDSKGRKLESISLVKIGQVSMHRRIYVAIEFGFTYVKIFPQFFGLSFYLNINLISPSVGYFN